MYKEKIFIGIMLIILILLCPLVLIPIIHVLISKD